MALFAVLQSLLLCKDCFGGSKRKNSTFLHGLSRLSKRAKYYLCFTVIAIATSAGREGRREKDLEFRNSSRNASINNIQTARKTIVVHPRSARWPVSFSTLNSKPVDDQATRATASKVKSVAPPGRDRAHLSRIFGCIARNQRPKQTVCGLCCKKSRMTRAHHHLRRKHDSAPALFRALAQAKPSRASRPLPSPTQQVRASYPRLPPAQRARPLRLVSRYAQPTDRAAHDAAALSTPHPARSTQLARQRQVGRHRPELHTHSSQKPKMQEGRIHGTGSCCWDINGGDAGEEDA
ncbi:uncharacterized protein K452DRAFT_347604 [Aplosporella prunicola CBS 121167]|uniref:Uncharacterized protein n=1 Tax=Aplosporella prunicola CBS 121167 TaxID=1176127 RepID=A0A6A6AU54_9PEZI|nr:uncharacterized protein K452DRAFT_347604 [Aplosporella prunicola CBS 121167]KAF2135542.1 hypothetical protein K452DRAFT_347604 [Aplosporella prunicola CBS 121167]